MMYVYRLSGLLALSFLFPAFLSAQEILTDNNQKTISFTGFTGSGFAPSPVAGQLDSDSWSITGLSDGTLSFGGEETTGDFARGSTAGGTTGGGVYAFDSGEGTTIFGVQPTGSDFSPGSFIMRLQNNTGSTITSLEVSYDIWVLNNATRANSFNFAHSGDNSVFTDESSLDFVTPEAADAGAAWTKTTKTITLSVGVNNGSNYYLRWNSDDVSGQGSRDEFGLGEVRVTGTAGTISEPSAMASNLIMTAQGPALNLSWTNGDGGGRLVLLKEGAAVDASPSDGTTYVANTIFGLGNEIGTGNFVVLSGGENSVSVVGLKANTVYHMAIFEFNGSGATIDYAASGSAIASQTTGTGSANLDFEANTFGDWFALSRTSDRDWTILNEAAAGANGTDFYGQINGFGQNEQSDDWLISPPISLTALDNPVLGFFTQTGFGTDDSEFRLLYSSDYSGGDPNTATWLELTFTKPANTGEWVASGNVDLSSIADAEIRLAFHYLAQEGNIRRWWLDEVSLQDATPVSEPTVAASSVSSSSITEAVASLTWTNGNGSKRLVVLQEGTSVDFTPIDGTTYSANSEFGSGQEVGTNTFVVFDGTNNSVDLTGLSPETQYAAAVFEYNATGRTIDYLATAATHSFTTLAGQAPSPISGAQDLFFSEYIEGSSNNKALEIFNGTGSDIDLGNYRIRFGNNGAGWQGEFEWTAGTILVNGEVRVIVDNGAETALRSSGDDLAVFDQAKGGSATAFNGNDARAIEKLVDGNWVIIDIIGDPDQAPGEGWSVGSTEIGTKEHTLVRKTFVFVGNTNWDLSRGASDEDSEWTVLPQNDFSNIGQHSFDPSAVSNPGGLQANAVSTTQIDISWVRNAADHDVVLAFNTENTFAQPTDGQALSVGADLGGATILAISTSTSFSHTSLTPGSTFYYRAWSVNSENEYSGGVSTFSATSKGEPSQHVSAFASGVVTGSSVALTWVDGAGAVSADAFVVIGSTSGFDAITAPNDGTPVADAALVKNVPAGTQQTSFGLLTPSTEYFFKIFPYSNSGSAIDFKTDASIPQLAVTTTSESQFENIGGTLTGEELITQLKTDFSVKQIMGWTNARLAVYFDLDLGADDTLRGVYTGHTMRVNRGNRSISQITDGNINGEHTFPQGFFDSQEPMVSDIHHIYPTLKNANSARSNHPFAEIDDSNTDSWWFRIPVGSSFFVTAPPSLDVRDLYSEFSDSGNDPRWEPREDHKGNVARAMFYFWSMYRDQPVLANDVAFFERQKDVLFQWHYQDLPDEREINRSNRVAAETAQGNRNPFVHDTSLVRRAFFPDQSAPNVNNVLASVTSIDFGVIRVGERDSVEVTLSNQSTTDQVTISVVERPTGAIFTDLPTSIIIPAGQNASFYVKFVPTQIGAVSGQVLTLSNSFNDQSISISSTGTGGDGLPSVFANTIDLGRLLLSDDPNDARDTVFVRNGGNLPFDIESVSFSAGFFEAENVFPTQVAPGDSAAIALIAVQVSGQNEDEILSFSIDGGAKTLQLTLSGTIERVTSSEDFAGLPSKFSLKPNFPNPFNPSTVIPFEVSQQSRVRLSVYDVLGRRVSELVNRDFAPGRFQVSFDARNLTSGIYLIRMETSAGGVFTRKMLLVK